MIARHHLRSGATRMVVHPLVTAVTRWPVESQQRARRNAMIASTALAQRRAEHDDVERFLATRHGDRAPEVAAEAAHG